MGKRLMTISEYKYSDGSYNIVLNNIGHYPNLMKKISDVIQKFATGDELFFGHYRIDGMHLSREDMHKYSLEIPAFFKTYGAFYSFCIPSQYKKYRANELVICRAPNEQKTYQMLCPLFNYYLETIVFSPKIDWMTFMNSYRDYAKNGSRNYVVNGYTDFLFAYVDSGDFIVSFNPLLYNSELIRGSIEDLIFGNTDEKFSIPK